MNIPSTVRTYLADSGGRFKGRQTDAGRHLEETVSLAGLSLEQVVRPVMLRSGKNYLMAVIRADQQLDLERISQLFKREFSLCTPVEGAELLNGCQLEALPPLAAPFGIRAIMDRSVEAMAQVYFPVGVPGLLINADAANFALLHAETWKGHRIARDQTEQAQSADQRDGMRRKVQQVNDLPAMPGLATELIRIKNNPYAHASELAAVIEQDPSLSAQLIRYATSPLYAYQGKISSVEQAIVRVLGMDFVQDIAFGLALGKAFNNPKEGPLGLNSFWRHAVYTATLTQALCERMDFQRRPSAGMGYLAGLLHNFGILLLGHLFPAQFQRLNQAREQHPDTSLLKLEQEILAVSHTEMGLWLMDAWDMPREIANAVSGHHNPALQGDYSIYANLVFVANVLLKRHGIGESEVMEIPEELLQRIGLSVEQVEAALGSVLRDKDGLAFMASRMAA
ncbi:MAG: HDOD domain-containing protein [Chromatiales bacterium]|nr:HDOD domain-containing protein [Gammaproteobacteria bacterium]MBW6477492.1 HDOD domain-containing protein [Chromatiales bacterium]